MKFIKPLNLKDALKIKSETSYPVLAGGTDIVAQWRSGLKMPEGIISIGHLSELAKMKDKKDSIEIGSLATHAAIYGNKAIKDNFPALVTACRSIGAVQIQNIGTIGGNIMNASPAGDTLPVLLAYEALAELQSVRRKRTISFVDFFLSYRKTAIDSDEILTKIIIKKPPQTEKSQFVKIGTRQAQSISKICGCFRRSNGRFFISFGSVAEVPIRCQKTEDFLSGKALTADVIEKGCEMVKSEIRPIDDIRSSGLYRAHVCSILLKRFLL